MITIAMELLHGLDHLPASQQHHRRRPGIASIVYWGTGIPPQITYFSINAVLLVAGTSRRSRP